MSSFAFIIPAYEAARSVGEVVKALLDTAPASAALPTIIVVDDGSKDDTSTVAAKAGASVFRHAQNRGKGAALRTGFALAQERGAEVAVTLDADAQHPANEAWRLALHPASAPTLLLGIRDLKEANAPRLNQVSNGISNFFLSTFGRRQLRDTQCGLRRYPVEKTLKSGVAAKGYAFEAEILLWAVLAGWPVEELPIAVVYPPEAERVTHFHNVKDPVRIVGAVLRTLARDRR